MPFGVRNMARRIGSGLGTTPAGLPSGVSTVGTPNAGALANDESSGFPPGMTSANNPDASPLDRAISGAYSGLIGREAAPNELDIWRPEFKKSLGGGFAGLLRSEEFKNRGLTGTQDEEALYRGILGRDIDPTGAAGWADKPLEDVFQGILGSPEFKTRSGTLARDQARWGLNGLLPPGKDSQEDLPTSTRRTIQDALAKMGGMEAMSGAPSGNTGQTRAIEDALYERAAARINQNYDLQARGENEAAFGRGVGSGTILPYFRSLLEEKRTKELADASRAAFTGAAGEARANTETQRRGLATSGDLGLKQQQLDLQGSQFGQNLAQRQSEFDRTLSQRGQEFTNTQDLARERLSAEDQSSFNALLAKLGIGAGGLLLSNPGNLSNTIGGQAASGLAKLFQSAPVDTSSMIDTTGLSFNNSPFLDLENTTGLNLSDPVVMQDLMDLATTDPALFEQLAGLI